MHLLHWPGPEVAKKSPEYEWAYIKAHLEGAPNTRAYSTYTKMYGESPKNGVPYWLVRLAVYYGALHIGYERIKRAMPGIEKRMLACVEKLDVNVLINDKELINHVRAKDFEDAAFGGRELVME